MTKFTKELESIISGQSYNEAIILQAVELADTLETVICLKALLSGHNSSAVRFTLQDFIVRIDTNTLNK